MPNAKFWNPCRDIYQKLLSLGVVLHTQWKSRRYNLEADELCNAALDRRQPDATVLSPTTRASIQLDTLLPRVLHHVETNKRFVIRTLPHELSKVWVSSLATILCDPLVSDDFRRQLFFIAPHLISAYHTHFRTAEHFKLLKCHISSLADPEYLRQTLEDILQPQSKRPSTATCTEEQRINTLASRGLFQRIVKDENISVADPASIPQTKVEAMFPAGPLPKKLPTSKTRSITMTYTDICAAARHMGRGKAAGLSGWTRELFMPLLHTSNTNFHAVLSDFFTIIINVTRLSPEEEALVTSSWLCLLTYKNKPGKTRPICIRDFISKLSWTHLISTNKDIRPLVSGSSYRKKGGCAAVALALQTLLDSDRFFMSMDMSNAFNQCNRQRVFDYVLSRGDLYFDMFPFLNLFYAEITLVHAFAFNGNILYTLRCSVGSAQGCTSGPFFFHLCVLPINLQLPQSVLNVADDIYLVEPDNACVDTFFELLQASHLHINSDKGCHIIGSRQALGRTAPLIAHLRQHHSIDPIPWHQPFQSLGTMLIPDWPLVVNQKAKYLQPALDAICCLTRKKLIALQSFDCTLQIKFLTLRAMQFFVLYIIQSVSHYLLTDVCKYIETLFRDTLENVAEFSIPCNRIHLLFKPLVVGGLGFIPFTDMSQTLRTNSESYLGAIMNGLSIPHQFTQLPHRSLEWIWNSITAADCEPTSRTRRTHTPTFAERAYCSWLSCWPNLKIRKFEDAEFRIGLQHILREFPSAPTTCISKRKGTFDYRTVSSADRHEHFLSCGRCGSACYHHRHECVLCEVVSAAKHHLYVVTKNPANMPVPGKQHGGPDLLLTPARGGCLVGDVAIASTSRSYHMNAIFNKKMKQYKTFSPAIRGTTFPFVMNTSGALHKKTIQILRDNSMSEAFIRDASINSQCALIKAIAHSFFRLFVRPSDTILNEIEEDDQPVDTDSDATSEEDDDDRLQLPTQ